MSKHHKYQLGLSLVVVVLCSSQVFALPSQVVHIDTPQCDPLSIPVEVDEIGDVTEFPADEALFATDLGPSNFTPCVATNITALPDFVVDIRNLSGRDWKEVWYVADPETNITNFDGEANDFSAATGPIHEAFRLDHDISDPFGIHHPLIFESIAFDGIWQAGETWRFVLQDYTNTLGLPPSAISSLGVGDASSTPASGIIDSSGSIIAVPIPEPASAVLLLLSAAATAVSRRRLV